MERHAADDTNRTTGRSAFARFVACGGGTGLASSFAVTAAASWMPWFVANAVITVISTLVATELHARFTFGTGGRATWRQHVQSAGTAVAGYAVTGAAMLALHAVAEAPGAALQQIVYLSASAVAGVARFAVLRLVVFARGRGRTTTAVRTVTVAATPAPAGPRALCPAA
ncbi:GtrA family protein [Streptomyces sp. NPDC020875]|uniref:GtrA family protein n=1 Tax=Streptomyces sp. NPDC020875 TaxID=3154898 RepID=UPI0033C23231